QTALRNVQELDFEPPWQLYAGQPRQIGHLPPVRPEAFVTKPTVVQQSFSGVRSCLTSVSIEKNAAGHVYGLPDRRLSNGNALVYHSVIWQFARRVTNDRLNERLPAKCWVFQSIPKNHTEQRSAKGRQKTRFSL